MTTSKGTTEAMRERLRNLIAEGVENGPIQGVNHIAVFAKDLGATARFYSEIMDMPVVRVSANRDVSESTHMNVAIGGGTSLAFFDFPHVPRLQRRALEGVGNVMHVVLPIARDLFLAVKGRLDRNKIKYRGIGGAIYVKAPNGLGIERKPYD